MGGLAAFRQTWVGGSRWLGHGVQLFLTEGWFLLQKVLELLVNHSCRHNVGLKMAEIAMNCWMWFGCSHCWEWLQGETRGISSWPSTLQLHPSQGCVAPLAQTEGLKSWCLEAHVQLSALSRLCASQAFPRSPFRAFHCLADARCIKCFL